MLRILSMTMGLFIGLMTLHGLQAQETGLEEAVTPEKSFQIVGFGDSLMAGYRLDSEKSFTAQLETALRAAHYDVTVNNAGVSGDTSTGGRERIDWSVPDGTDLVILELGANDMLRGISPELTRENIDFMLHRLQERKIPVILAGMMSAPNYGEDYAKAFNPIYPDMAAKYHLALYPFFLEGVAGHKDLQLDDGMHPNDQGVGVMVKHFMPVIEKELVRLGVTKTN